MVEEVQRDRITGLAAEVAFFAVLSLFPGLLALTAGLGSLEAVFGADAAQETERVVLDGLRSYLGEGSGPVREVDALFARPRPGLLTVGLVLALIGLSRGFDAVIKALDVAYGIEEGRPWYRRRLLALGMSLGTLVAAVVLLATLVLGPLLGGGQQVADVVGLGEAFATGWDLLRWPTALVVLMGWATVIYHLAPNHRTPWRWDLPGAVLAGGLWVLTSTGFQLYLRLAGDGNQVFGALGGALTLLFWLYLLSIGLLLGGELNSVLAGRHGVVQEPAA
jgi:membrane protein